MYKGSPGSWTLCHDVGMGAAGGCNHRSERQRFDDCNYDGFCPQVCQRGSDGECGPDDQSLVTMILGEPDSVVALFSSSGFRSFHHSQHFGSLIRRSFVYEYLPCLDLHISVSATSSSPRECANPSKRQGADHSVIRDSYANFLNVLVVHKHSLTSESHMRMFVLFFLRTTF